MLKQLSSMPRSPALPPGACGRFEPHPESRRDLLRRSAIGFGALALAGLLADEKVRAEAPEAAPPPAGDPLLPRAPHHRPRAKRVIFLFMHGGPSQVDTFDFKPLLQRDDGKPFPGQKPRIQSGPTGNLLASPWSFAPRGRSGIPVSELFPRVGALADDLCIINSLHGSNSRHGGALLELHTGSDTFVRPSMGSWITYGLGSESRNLPGFVTLCPTLGHGGVNAWSSAFLPAHYQGTPIGNSQVRAEEARIPFSENRVVSPRRQRLEIELAGALDRARLERRGPDAALEARIANFELAFRMQREVPALQDLAGEKPETLKLYGIDDEVTRNFGIQCLMARRFAEAGVRFVQATHSYKWDQHSGLRKDHARNAAEVDKPIAALITDLKRRGLLEDTLVLWGGEFGRTPTEQGNRDGRDHNPHAVSMFLAGGGVRGGLRYGRTDDYGYYAVEDKVHFHDLHATILHLLGLDHERLTFRHAGRDFRLTDVYGRVVEGIMA
jgi:hypothetical protein